MNTQHFSKATLLLVALCGLAGIAHADQRRDDDRNGRDGRDGRDRRGVVLDHRYNHDHYYPARGAYVGALPPGARSLTYRGSPYFFQGGAWYRSYGPRYVVVRPPLGISIGILPPFYSTVWFGGVPYYYADDTYYRWRASDRTYEVVEPPASESSATTAAPAANNDLFIYPKNGQSEQQQATDRYECHSWAKKQTSFDPTQPLGGVDEAQSSAKRADYQRAEGACLEARGYTVK